MRKNRHRHLAWLGLLVVIAVMGGSTQSGAQLRLNLDQSWGDYTWGAWGASREASRLGREDLVARENYCPSNGCVLRLDQVQVLPVQCRKGECVTLIATYTILTPEQIGIPVTITREIVFQGKSLGKTRSMESRQLNGTWSQEVDFTLPANAAAGTYTLNTRVTTGYGMDQKSAQFRVD